MMTESVQGATCVLARLNLLTAGDFVQICSACAQHLLQAGQRLRLSAEFYSAAFEVIYSIFSILGLQAAEQLDACPNGKCRAAVA